MSKETTFSLGLIKIANDAKLKNPVLLINKKDHHRFGFKRRTGKITISTCNFIQQNRYNLMSKIAFNNLKSSLL